MSVIFSFNETIGKVTLFPYAITNGERVEPCMTEEYANKKLLRKPFSDGSYSVIQSDEPSEELLKVIKGVRFDTLDDAENFINGGGYKESSAIKIENLETQLTDTQLALCEVYEMML